MKVLNPYLDGSWGIYIPWTLSFLDKKRSEKSFAFGGINKGYIYIYIINKIVSMVGPSRDLLYTYKSKEIITSDMNDSYNCSRWRSMTVYHAYNTFNLGDHLGFST
jgi:hypothetical protein